VYEVHHYQQQLKIVMLLLRYCSNLMSYWQQWCAILLLALRVYVCTLITGVYKCNDLHYLEPHHLIATAENMFTPTFYTEEHLLAACSVLIEGCAAV
jgi:hypothetical protein